MSLVAASLKNNLVCEKKKQLQTVPNGRKKKKQNQSGFFGSSF